VVVNCQQDLKAAEQVAGAVRKAGGEAIAYRADVTDFEQARGLVEHTLKTWGRIDILVNTVGILNWKNFSDLEPAEWRRVISSNLDSVFNTCRLVLPQMRERRFGRIVNFAAVGAEATLGEPQMAAYSAAKAGVVAFSKALASSRTRPATRTPGPRTRCSATGFRWATPAAPPTWCGPSCSS
jgi:3-oxoacyl-[acyl-carrier protein] reductase